MLGETGRLLAESLKGYRKKDIIVVAIPKGGIAIGHEIAKELNLTLDITLIQKIGHQFNKDFPIGYVGLTNRTIMWASNISIEYVNEVTKQIQKKLREEYYHYTGRKEPYPLNGKTVIIADDVICSGDTFLRAIQLIQKDNPLRIIAVASAVALNAVDKISKQVQTFIYHQRISDPRNEKEMLPGLAEIEEKETMRLLRNNA